MASRSEPGQRGGPSPCDPLGRLPDLKDMASYQALALLLTSWAIGQQVGAGHLSWGQPWARLGGCLMGRMELAAVPRDAQPSRAE